MGHRVKRSSDKDQGTARQRVAAYLAHRRDEAELHRQIAWTNNGEALWGTTPVTDGEMYAEVLLLESLLAKL